MDEEKCSDDARCAVCTTPVMAAYSVCQKFNNINHECLQKVSTYDHLKKMPYFFYMFLMFMTHRSWEVVVFATIVLPNF